MCNCLDKSFRCLGISANVAFGLMGAALAGVSFYTAYGQQDVELANMELMTRQGFVWTGVAGAGMLVTSIVGCAGLKTRLEKFLIPYTLFVLILLVGTGVATVGLHVKGMLMRALDKHGVEKADLQGLKAQGSELVGSALRDFARLYDDQECNPSADAAEVLSVVSPSSGDQIVVFDAYTCGDEEQRNHFGSRLGLWLKGLAGEVMTDYTTFLEDMPAERLAGFGSKVAECYDEFEMSGEAGSFVCAAYPVLSRGFGRVIHAMRWVATGAFVLEFIIFIACMFALRRKPKSDKAPIVAAQSPEAKKEIAMV